MISDDPSNVAVVCVECQNGVLGPASVLPQLAADACDLIINLRRLLDAARSAGIRVVHATYEGALGGTEVGTARLWRALRPATTEWGPGSEATQVLPELLAPIDLVLPRHHGLFPTAGSELLPVLANLGIRTVVLTGVSLNLALPHTAGDTTQAGFNLVVPRDAVGGTPAAYGEQVLNHTIALLGRITTVDELIGAWSTHSGAQSA
ncbi:isochorismatase family protein [Mycobacterium xenopi]|nr:cysteine hydrolase family protein [Mycobacterium xenopi]EUA51566.1 isochorismatase family protein [Mycobacterium xenopi 3993]MDA3639593.1 cysteine hydrolase family protein [Mycobacterium xenopi]MDA3657833.1 cysteine hydrolase family protein [Mycobacterium xenopi]MDA3663657.1 cysteine hydrolase family protein [Mycobacterium xenopi]ORX20473.1 cysteine hydrolase [Mycobacterium xenopi]